MGLGGLPYAPPRPDRRGGSILERLLAEVKLLGALSVTSQFPQNRELFIEICFLYSKTFHLSVKDLKNVFFVIFTPLLSDHFVKEQQQAIRMSGNFVVG